MQEKQVALVTGGNRGIGRAISLAFASAGIDVAINFRSRADEAAEVAGEIRRLGRNCAAIQADVSQSRDVERLAAEAERSLGAIGILVNNAGIARPQAIEEITEQDWDDLIRVNLKSSFLVSQR
ncbi:MAG TPA: SDR family NAD(P)-dependent oxidoreductase, partial [Bryobacteraceae bacterium]|nr:SDR family NAD(P)-dependent oxidoreductase [Bryobacteraceae bacterium]